MAWLPGTSATSSVKTVTSAGTPVQLSTVHKMVYAVMFQALPFNTNRVVIGSDNTVRAGDASSTNPSGPVLAILGKGSATETPASGGASVKGKFNGIDLYDLWLDSVTNDEGIVWSYIEA